MSEEFKAGREFAESVDRLAGCKCTIAQRVLGDGCYVCNPEHQEEMADE